MDQSQRAQLLTPATYFHLIDLLGDVSEGIYRALLKAWGIDAEQFKRLKIRACPSRLQNLLIAYECHRRLGSDLGRVPGFYPSENVYGDELWWIDLNPSLARNGFILPERHPRFGFIDRLRVYRCPVDLEGFVLTTREESERKAA